MADNSKKVPFVKEIWNSRKLIIQLAKNDFKTKYAGSYFGIIWAFIQPIITIMIYVFVFGMGLKMTPKSTEYPFLLYLIAGIVPWFFFADAWINSTNCLIEYSYLVKKMVFKISILPIVKVISSLFVHLFFILLGFVIFMIAGRTPGIAMVQVFYYMFCEICLVLALTYFTASVTPFFRDMAQIINITTQLGMWLTPIMWDESIMPAWVMSILKFNPMYYIVNGYRDCFIYGRWIPQHYVTLFLYDEKSDKIFLGDSGDLTHNRQWVPLKKVYRSLKKSNPWQILQVTSFDKSKDNWKHKGFGGNAILPKEWK